MKIRGRFEAGRDAAPSPFVRAVVQLENGKSALVNLLIDTGADETTIHPADSTKLGIGIIPLGAPDNELSFGIGGSAEYNHQNAKLEFKAGKQTHEWEGKIAIGPCGDANFTFALNSGTVSVLGRDFLSRGRLVVDDVGRQVFVEMHPDAKVRKKQESDKMREVARRRKMGRKT